MLMVASGPKVLFDQMAALVPEIMSKSGAVFPPAVMDNLADVSEPPSASVLTFKCAQNLLAVYSILIDMD
jgi:hypothetical protein